ncbi:thiamine-phosphate kinase [Flavitalea antarctica]
MATETVDKEIARIKKIAGTFLRHPRQLNKMFESDSEVISIEGLHEPYLVAKTDGIYEEISTGLYKDPYLIGWMAITVTVSDLAATGANLTGILLSLQVPGSHEESWMKAFQQGINEACAVYDTYILGGDTNFTQHVSVNTTGLGFVSKPMSRTGVHPGDLLYATSTLGSGNMFAYSVFFDNSVQHFYKPTARLQESKLIRSFATACIDTSDGLFPALSVLAEINSTGVQFYEPLQAFLSSETGVTCEKAGIPSWLFLAGPHGEYELLFTISPAQQSAFEKACIAANWLPLLLGEATQDKELTFVSEQLEITCHPSEIANLYHESGGDINTYFDMLMRKHRHWCDCKENANKNADPKTYSSC